MVALPVVLHTRLTGRTRLRRTFFGRYVVEVEEVSWHQQLKWPRPGSTQEELYSPPDKAPLVWRDARGDDSWLLARQGLL